MITTAEFKNQIGKSFGQEMRKLGFKGSGFDYFEETENFLFAVYIDSGRWGGSCSTGLAIHPKQVDINSQGKLDLKKLKIHSYEFRLSLSGVPRSKQWKYSEEKEKNTRTLNEIVNYIKKRAIPIIDLFKGNPNILDTFEVSHLDSIQDNILEKTGAFLLTTDPIRFAWVMTKYFRKQNPAKAKQFAEYGLLQLKKEAWFGKAEFKRVLK